MTTDKHLKKSFVVSFEAKNCDKRRPMESILPQWNASVLSSLRSGHMLIKNTASNDNIASVKRQQVKQLATDKPQKRDDLKLFSHASYWSNSFIHSGYIYSASSSSLLTSQRCSQKQRRYCVFRLQVQISSSSSIYWSQNLKHDITIKQHDKLKGYSGRPRRDQGPAYLGPPIYHR